jgi:hypothetical protein
MKNYLLYFCMKSHPNKIYYENIFFNKSKKRVQTKDKAGDFFGVAQESD